MPTQCHIACAIEITGAPQLGSPHRCVSAAHLKNVAFGSGQTLFTLPDPARAVVAVGNQIRIYRWCNPPRIGSGRMLPIAWTGLVSGESLANARCVLVPL